MISKFINCYNERAVSVLSEIGAKLSSKPEPYMHIAMVLTNDYSKHRSIDALYLAVYIWDTREVIEAVEVPSIDSKNVGKFAAFTKTRGTYAKHFGVGIPKDSKLPLKGNGKIVDIINEHIMK